LSTQPGSSQISASPGEKHGRGDGVEGSLPYGDADHALPTTNTPQ
jgi:hypothetical protein